MKKTKLLSVALLAAAWLTTGSVHAWDEPAQDANGVWQLGSVNDVEWFADYVEAGNTTANAVLTSDIDYEGQTHTPIGQNQDRKYNGVFDGQHFRIKNLHMTGQNTGFFGFVRGGTTIQNIIFDSTCHFSADERCGSLIGFVQAKAGGAISINNVVNFASVTSGSKVAGGIVAAGHTNNDHPVINMANCVNAGLVKSTGGDKAAALIGWNKSASISTLKGCYNIGELSPVDGANNLFRGTNRSMPNCFDLVNTTASGSTGTQGLKTDWVTEDPLHSGELCFVLNSGDMSEKGIKYTQDLSDPNSIPMPMPGKTVYQVADLDCAGNPKGGVTYSNTDGGSQDDHNYDTATGLCTVCSAPMVDWMNAEADGFFYLGTPTQVEWFSAMVRAGYGAMNAKLTADIDYQGVPDAHMPIGTSTKKYFGHFDGQGHRIKGMVLTPASRLNDRVSDGNGFFGSVRGGGTSVDNIYTNEVIIENLIIDSSCSIQHDNNFAAGVVAHINSRNDEQSNIIIRNCGNEANVSTTGKNAAGILGCVEGTNVGLKLYNLWNKGNIKGDNGESAAICAWTGQRNVNGEVDVEGCWNIGEVTGVDKNGYNLVRRNTDIVLRNVVDLCITNAGNQGKVSVLNTEDPISSGELCYLLNGDQTDIVYYQTLGTDAMPVYRDATHGQVYQSGTVDCAGAATGSFGYNNVGGETVQLGHHFNAEIGMCDVCYKAEYEEPVKDGDYYLLKNAGNVEWLSNAIANGGGAAFYAKLMNDIDFLKIENLHNPLGPTKGSKFKGVFDGQGYSIKNMIINRPTVEAQGFFGWLQGNDNTTIKNLIIDSSCSIIGSNKCGGLAGASQNESNVAKITIENVVNEADVTVSGQDAAGIVGGEDGGKATYYIHNVVNTGTITSTHQAPFAGALFCYQERGAIENFLNLGKIVGHNGGNIGRFGGTWTNVVDLSETDNKTQSVREDLTPEDIVNGKLAYVMGFKQLIGTDKYPSPLNAEEVNYVGDAGYATMYDKANDWALNGDATAYIAAASFDGKYLQLTEVKDVPAGAAVILKGSYYNKLATTATSDVTANELLGTDAEMVSDGTQYCLAKYDDTVGFYRVDEGTAIAAGKAYYQSTSGVKAFYFGNGDATSIQTIDNAQKTTEDAIYNIAGQRLNKVQKGINIINGKKVLY
ncbi:MAG: hypothetical protein UH685_03980 [Bacteroidaceae bacterium]|nr:hypothetical protein [Bacteroidaceae bacterium]